MILMEQHGTSEDWCELQPSKAMVTIKEKKAAVTTTTTKNGRAGEGKGTGSRRIFSPVFKLQVLDSYRQDADCQGNQRATARKYGIHRRQIQKWLQMESNLRLSVQQKCSSTTTTMTALNLSSPGRQPDATKECITTVSGSITSQKNNSHDSNNVVVSSSNETEDSGCSISDSEEYVNVDEVSDSEDDDETSSCSSYERNDKALDFTSATLSKRRFYSTDFKVHVLDAFKNDTTCKGNQRATARKFGIHRRQVQKWLNQEHLIKSEQMHRNNNNNNKNNCNISSNNNNNSNDDNHYVNTTCLDLSPKRKLPEDATSAVVDDILCKRTKLRLADGEIQESALCLVKNKHAEPSESNSNNINILSNHQHRHVISYSSPLEHSCSPPNLFGYPYPEYPFCMYRPWHCCYQQIRSTRNGFDGVVAPKYSYALNLKCETSYVDIPVQYGFGDSVPSKWLKENPLFLHGPPSPYL